MLLRKLLMRRYRRQYPLPMVTDFEHPYRFLHPHESPKEGDEVWNFHFRQWCEWREFVDGTVNENRLRKPNQIYPSPRLCLVRTKRPASEYDTTHPIINELEDQEYDSGRI